MLNWSSVYIYIIRMKLASNEDKVTPCSHGLLHVFITMSKLLSFITASKINVIETA